MIYMHGQILGTHSFLLKGDFLKPDEYSEMKAKFFLPGDETGTAATVLASLGADVKIDGTVGMYSGIFNNPFIIWGRYRRKFFRYNLPVSFQFHHTQMDGEQAGKFLENLKSAIIGCYK